MSCATHLEGREMDHAVDIGMRLKDLIQCRFIGNIGLVEGRSLSREELDTVDSNFGRVVQVIYDDDLIAMVEKGESSEGPDISRTTTQLGG